MLRDLAGQTTVPSLLFSLKSILLREILNLATPISQTQQSTT